jgi:putative transposase
MRSVETMTIANGGDNIGFYTPVFAGSSPVQLTIFHSASRLPDRTLRGIVTVTWVGGPEGVDETGCMKPPPDPHYRHRFPAAVISHAVWLYHVFSLSLRDVELLLAERGIVVSYETVRRWCSKFSQTFANRLRCRRPRPGDKWHMDEVATRTTDAAF